MVKKYNSDENKLGWIVGGVGFIYLFAFLYFFFIGDVGASIISGISMLAIFVIDMLVFRLTKYCPEEVD